MFLTKNLTRYGYGCLLALVLVGVFLAVHIDISVFGADSGLIRTAGHLSTGTCTRSGVYTLKFVRNLSAHSTYTTHWSPGLPKLQFGFQITVDGFGYMLPSITYTVNGVSGNHTWAPLKVGDWGHRGALSLWAPYSTRVTAYTGADWTPDLDIDVQDAYGQYNWSSSGTVTLQAKYCKRTSPFWCEWEDVSSTVSEPFSGSGSWELKMTYVCHKCNQDVRYPSEHHVTCSGIQRYARGTFGSCGASYWKCDPSDVRKHRVLSCGEYKYRLCTGHYCFQNSVWCPAGSTCDTASSGSSSSGSSSGTTTSPTVQNNGGGTTGGTSGGDSGSAVACSRGSSCSLGGRASSATAHRQTCLAGHTYWKCHSSRLGYGNEWHKTQTCLRTGCGVSSSRCLNGSDRSPCRAINPRTGTNYIWHKLSG